MSEFFKLIDINNRIKYKDLKDIISRMPMMTFMDEIRMPFLIGKELFEGSMSKGSGALDTSTMKFSISEVKENPNAATQPNINSPAPSSAISKAVYIITKNPSSDEPRRDVFTIGRASYNDITIADYVISKRHAAIQCVGGRFFIEDVGSTNGIKVDGVKVEVGEKVQLIPGVDISFGRYCFVFTKPIDLFNRIRKEVSG